MDMQLAEAPGKLLVLLRGDLLVTKEQDLMLHPRIVDFALRRVVQRLREVDSRDFGTESRGDGFYSNMLVGHGASPFYPLILARVPSSRPAAADCHRCRPTRRGRRSTRGIAATHRSAPARWRARCRCAPGGVSIRKGAYCHMYRRSCACRAQTTGSEPASPPRQ